MILGKDSLVEAHSVASHGDIFFRKLRQLNVAQRVSSNIGDRAFVYEAAKGIDNPQISIWQRSFYGEMTMTSAHGKDFSSTFGAMTGPSRIKERAEARTVLLRGGAGAELAEKASNNSSNNVELSGEKDVDFLIKSRIIKGFQSASRRLL